MARSGLKGDAGGRLRRGKRSIIRVINTNRYCTGRGKGVRSVFSGYSDPNWAR